VNLSELVRSIASDAEFEAQEKGTKVVVTSTTNLAVLGDPNLLRSAVENVLRNAMRYTRPGTAVEVALQAASAANHNEVLILIRDHGKGVPENELGNIFKSFYRVPDAPEHMGGSGLGLAITERIVTLHGGRIRAVNEPDGGLRVEMIFPRLLEPAV
jgi:two-component system, OmpR family, sensor histidine kinase CpxA